MVAMATLLLGVLAVGFTTVVVNEMKRTSNFDLSKSAYDSALAGIEDAKLAIMNYRSCLEQDDVVKSADNPADSSSPVVSCSEIIWYMENPDCNMVGHILGRIPKSGEHSTDEVRIQETEDVSGGTGENNMEQAYTCVKITSPHDYRTRLNTENTTRVIPIKLKSDDVSDINYINVSWAENNGIERNFTNFQSQNGITIFPTINGDQSPSNPPTIMVQLVQTAPEFSITDFDFTQGNRTDRGFVVLVPSDTRTGKTHGDKSSGTHVDVTSDNTITAAQGFLKSNDKTSKNLPFLIDCSDATNADKAFLCSSTIELPKPVGTTNVRSEQTFTLIVSLPYESPDTEIAISLCKTKASCTSYSFSDEGGAIIDNSSSLPPSELTSQIRIDSTGRANNLYRRVESRVETNSNLQYSFSYDAIQALGDQTDVTIKKTIEVDQEKTEALKTPPAKICRKNFTLNFNANGTNVYGMPGSISECDNEKAYFVLPTERPTRSGYNFVGWATSTSSTRYYQPGEDFDTASTNSTLYAIWKAGTVNVSYYDTIGRNLYQTVTPTFGSTTAYYGYNDLRIPRPLPPAEGFTLLGWSETPNSTVATHKPSETFRAERDIKLYAVWYKSVTINFYQLDNTPSPKVLEFYNGNENTVFQAPTVNRPSDADTNWVILGWSRKNNQFDYAYDSGESGIHITASEAAAQTTYYAAMRYVKNVSYLIESTPYYTDQTDCYTNFVYVYSNGPTGNRNEYAAGFPLPAKPADQLVWDIKNGYKFMKWCIKDTSNCYDAGTTISDKKTDLVFKAQLMEGTYTITFKSSSGDKTYGTQDFKFNTATNIRKFNGTGWANNNASAPYLNAPTGKSFVGWSTMANSRTATYSDNQSLSDVKQDTTLYAVWSKSITIKFIQYTGVNQQTYTYYNDEPSYAVKIDTISDRSGYTVAGWSDSKTSYNKVLDSGNGSATVNLDSDRTYYAGYTKEVIVNYNANGGSGEMASTIGSAYYMSTAKNAETMLQTTVTLSSNRFTRDNYNFKGWAYASAGGRVYGETAQIPVDRNPVTVYANWKQLMTVYFKNHDGTQTFTTATREKGSSYTLAGNFTLSNRDFVGWNTSKNQTSANAQNGDTITMNQNYTYYSVSKKDVSIGFISKAGTDTKSCTLWNGNTACTVTAPTLNNYGSTYTAYTWSTSTSSISNTVNSGGSKSIGIGTGNMYGVYKYTVTVSFNANGGSGTAPSAVTATAYTITSGSNLASTAAAEGATIPANPFTKTGYNTKEWGSSADGGTSYSVNQVVHPTSDLTLYAQFEIVPYTCAEGTLVTGDPKGDGICVKDASYSSGSYYCASQSTTTNDEQVCATQWYQGSGGSSRYWGPDGTREWYEESYSYSGPGSECSGTLNGNQLYYFTKHITRTTCTDIRYSDGYYYCPGDWSNYSGSGYTLKCYKAATRQ